MHIQRKWCVALLLLASCLVARAHTNAAAEREQERAGYHYMTLEERRMADLDRELEEMTLKQEQAESQQGPHSVAPAGGPAPIPMLQQMQAQRQALLEVAGQTRHSAATRLHSTTNSAARSFAAVRGRDNGHTRCPTGNGFMSCPYANAECCADGQHCCRPGTRCSTANGHTQCASTAQNIAIHPTIVIRRHQQPTPSEAEISQENKSEQQQEEANGMDRNDPLDRDVGPSSSSFNGGAADDAGPIKQNIIIVKNINVLTHGIQQAPYVTGASEQQQSSESHSSGSLPQVSIHDSEQDIDRDGSSSGSSDSGSDSGSSDSGSDNDSGSDSDSLSSRSGSDSLSSRSGSGSLSSRSGSGSLSRSSRSSSGSSRSGSP